MSETTGERIFVTVVYAIFCWLAVETVLWVLSHISITWS